MLKNFRTYHLSVALYRSTRTLRLPSHLRSQLDRAASSATLNLAEGAGRRTTADQRRFFDIAFASVKEVQAILDLANDPSTQVVELADRLAAHIHKLRSSL